MSVRGILPTALALAGRSAPRVSTTTPTGVLVTLAFLYYVLVRAKGQAPRGA